MKIYYETDEIGTHKVIDYENGRTVRLLKKPSESYQAKREANAAAELQIAAERKAKLDAERLIQAKMRAMAIAELEKEGTM